MMKITESELLEALRASVEREAPNDDGSFTSREVADLMGWGRAKARRAIRALLRAGEIETMQTYRENIQGRVAPTIAWRPVGERVGAEN